MSTLSHPTHTHSHTDPQHCAIQFDDGLGLYSPTVKQRATARLLVDYAGHPQPLHAEWTSPNQHYITHSNDKYTLTTVTHNNGQSSSTLLIHDADIADMGDYRVRVYGSTEPREQCTDDRTFHLSVEEPPTVSVPAELHVLAKHELTAQCNVIGYPASDVHWTWTECPLGQPPHLEPWSIDTTACRQTRLDAAVDMDANATVVVHNRSVQNSTLRFRPLAPGRLTCSATNSQSPSGGGGGASTDSTTVYVWQRPQAVAIEAEPALWIAGNATQLVCLVHAFNYTQEVWWQRDGRPVDGDGRVRVERTFADSMHQLRLHFGRVQADDAGTYACHARTFDQQEHTFEHTQHVYEPRAAHFGDAVDEEAAATVRLQRGDRLRLECRPEGVPVPHVKWLLNDELLDMSGAAPTNGTFEFGAETLGDDAMRWEHVLSVDRLDGDAVGVYECVAENEHGRAVQRTTVEMQQPGPSRTTIGVVCGLLALLLVTIVVGYYFYRREHKKWLLLKSAGIAYFDNGNMRDYNPDLSRAEQADLLPYDMKYEFPRERLKLSGVKLGHGAFGVVYKAVALGIQPEVDETTVAVKTIKHTDKDEDIKALISELKIMIHMGKHVNVVNLLGAVTRDIRQRSLFVIIEYCDLGNLYNFLKKNRNHFVNQVDHVSDEINPAILTVQQQVNE